MKVFLFVFMLSPLLLQGQEFQNVLFLDSWSNNDLVTSSSQVRYNDCFGYSFNDNEYAIAGSTEGTHFFKITDDSKFEELDFVEGAFSSAQVVHRDFKTFENYLYAVCDEGNSSLQIIDLSFLPDSVHVVNEIFDLIGRAHNLFVDEKNSLLYAFSVTPTLSGQPQTPVAMRVFSLADPVNPQLLYSGPDDIIEVHDGYVRDNNAILNCGVDGIRRYDFSNPTTPIFTQNIPFYQDQGYNHQGWLNPKGDVYIFADESNGKLLKKCTVLPDGEIQISSYFGIAVSEGSVPHNITLDDQFAYVAYYNYGLRIFDYTKTPVQQVAFFDTYPDNKTYKLNGAWGVFNGFKSKRILVSDRSYGLFLLDFDREKFINRQNIPFQVYPNPVLQNEELTFFINTSYDGILEYTVTDILGNKVTEGQLEKFNYVSIPMNVEAGKYFLNVTYAKNQELVEEHLPIIVH